MRYTRFCIDIKSDGGSTRNETGIAYFVRRGHSDQHHLRISKSRIPLNSDQTKTPVLSDKITRTSSEEYDFMIFPTPAHLLP